MTIDFRFLKSADKNRVHFFVVLEPVGDDNKVKIVGMADGSFNGFHTQEEAELELELQEAHGREGTIFRAENKGQCLN